MATEIPRWLVEFILLGPEDDRRQLQDSPILGDVWVEFAKEPTDQDGKDEALELLITPYKDNAAGRVATTLTLQCNIKDADIAHLQGIIAARMRFDDVVRNVVPLTKWWTDRRISEEIRAYAAKPATMVKDIQNILTAAYAWRAKRRSSVVIRDVETRKRYIALAGLILRSKNPQFAPLPEKLDSAEIQRISAEVGRVLTEIFRELYKPKPDERGLIWTVSLNRRATAALTRSVSSVKADAARTLFTVDCSTIVWAIIDSGVDATHAAFMDADGSRVRRSLDFSQIRKIVSVDNLNDQEKRAKRAKELLRLPRAIELKQKDTEEILRELAEGAARGRSIDWELAEQLIEIDPKTPPNSNHGTHVAGILAARKIKDEKLGTRKKGVRKAASVIAPDIPSDQADGMCPDIGIFDFRVLGSSLLETEFAIIAALQYIRYINDRNSWFTIHGANLSLSIPHDVRNYACGRTPVCRECERLVDSGVVVVAAAGNRGYQNFETKEGLYEGYAAFSITDPGNAEGVITVGATHRYWPHTYGVSFFSSRGPTGDGRIKPDLVAPGERIRAPLPRGEWGDLDGTSMAAPHVSGAAAMLMARYSELIGQPRRIKQILCESATDLGRERSFQGHGMLDVLRAFQSI